MPVAIRSPATLLGGFLFFLLNMEGPVFPFPARSDECRPQHVLPDNSVGFMVAFSTFFFYDRIRKK